MIFERWCGICVCVLSLIPALQAQQSAEEQEWYVTWGYNRSAYAESTVHMWGVNSAGTPFDLTLHDAQANDMPERFQAKVYFHPGLFTIPQFNARFGKRVAENWWVSAGWDHMKYKLKKQWVLADGFASAHDFIDEAPETQQLVLDGDSLYWGPGFNLEHSDGMNFVRFSAEHEHPLWESRNGEFALRAFEAAGAGLVVCSSDFRWAGERVKNNQHISGLGVGIHLGFRARFHRRFFAQVTGQAGAVTLPWIRIQGATDAGAEQSIRFVEGAFAVGYLIGGSHRNEQRRCNSCPRW